MATERFEWITENGTKIELITKTYNTTTNDGWGNEIVTGESVRILSCIINGSTELKNASFNGTHDMITGRVNGHRVLTPVPEVVYNSLFAERDAKEIAAAEESDRITQKIAERDAKMRKHGFGEDF